ncbi:alpha/beta hydrolase-fold protein [Agaribacter flavus]|uniref:Alpha/beta hydrolase-fold protein n=1 Tax=Agaribacter flavus TaxID=1902781 RepID=A0ABV7FQP7_9ALTE
MNTYTLLFLVCTNLIAGCSGGSADSPPTQVNEVPPSPPPASSSSDSGKVTVTRLSSEPSIVQANFWPSETFVFKGSKEARQTITSAFTNATYTYHVYLPSQYSQQSDKAFPMLLFTDGEWYAEFQFRVLDYEQRQIIAVGIEHGGRRAIDYILPGARSYHLFLTEELIPTIEAQYRILTDHITLKGDSGGGSQTLISMLLDDQSPPIFRHHLAFDPYIAGIGNINTLIQERDTQFMNKSLVVTGMRKGFHQTVEPFVQNLKNSSLQNLDVYHAVYDLEHQDATWSSFSNALAIIYDD